MSKPKSIAINNDTIFIVSQRGDWSNSGSKHIGYFKSRSYLQIGEWLLLNTAEPSGSFDIKEIDINDVTELDIKYASSMNLDGYSGYTINQIIDNKKELQLERIKRKALDKLSIEEKQALGLV